MSQQASLLFEKFKLSELVEECYCDVFFGKLAGGVSQGICVIFIPDNTLRRSACSW